MSRTGGYTAFSSLLSIGNDTDSNCGLYELTVFALPGRNFFDPNEIAAGESCRVALRV